jgi:hypothetical protein
MAGPNSTKFFERKQALIKETSEAKNKGMELGNALNNATQVYVALLSHPDIDPTKAAEDIMDWVEFFLGMKEVLKTEKTGLTTEDAVKQTVEIFQGSTQQSSPPPQPPAELCTEPQTKKIWVELHRIGYKDEDHLANIKMILGLSNLKSIKNLTKSQATKAINLLIKTTPLDDDDVPF